jgi:catechol 2,3-dioxygenase-like lactoylglutathione lyase family enzyme
MFGAPIPILRSFDEARTRDFYLNFLGFELLFEHRFEPGTPLYMGVRKGACELNLSEHYGDGTPGAAVRIPIDDVVAYAAELRAKQSNHARPGEPQRMEWGTREITIQDPSSNKLIFFTEVRDGQV